MKRTRILVAMASVLLAGQGTAGQYSIDFATTLTNGVFAEVAREAGLGLAYRGVAPAEPGGLTGFDLGAEVSAVDIDASRWEQVLDGGTSSAPSYLPIPRLHLRKGLPFNLDVGAVYAYVPDSNIQLAGAELQWAVLEGSAATPALAVRGSYSILLGVDDLELETFAADLLVSKGFLMFTPYLGAGVVHISAAYGGDDPVLSAALDDQRITEPRVFGGVQMSLALLRLTFDAEYSAAPTYTLKASFGW